MATCSHDNKVRLFDMAVLEDDGDDGEDGEEEEEKESDDDDNDDDDNDNNDNEDDSDNDNSDTSDTKAAAKPQKRARDDSSDSDSKPTITKKKSVSARNLKRQKIVPNKSSGFFDDLSPVS